MSGSEFRFPRPLPLCRPDVFAVLQRPVWILDTVILRKSFANPAALKLWCVEPGEEAEFFSRDFTPHSEAIRQRLGRLIERVSRGEVVSERWTFYPKQRPFTVDALMSGVLLDNGHVGMLVEAEHGVISPDELRAAEALRHTLVHVALFDATGHAIYRNPAAERSFPGDARSFVSMFADQGEGERMWQGVVAHDPVRPDAFMGRTVSADYLVVTAQGERWHGIDARTTTDPVSGRLSVLVNQRDVTDSVEATSRAEFYAGYDVVTGLANRHRFAEELDRAMAAQDTSGGLLTFDLNGFKEINDSYGHAVGDAVLREIGVRLKRAARPEDICARLGGDEFAVILPGVSDPHLLASRAEQIGLGIGAPIGDAVSASGLSVSASIGLALWPQDGVTPDALQRNADLALYAAKAEGGRHVHHFDAAMRRAADERYRCIDDLRAGLAAGEFEVFFQPLVAMANRRLIGFEALARWRHPQRGLLLPAHFLQEAESVGLMVPIGERVVREACHYVTSWMEMGIDPGRIAINLSRNNFRAGASVDELVAIIGNAGLNPDQFEFEVSEAVTFGARGETAIETLVKLRDQGFSIALDDFGTGHASLMHLRRLPVSTIKLDRFFITEMEHSVADRALVRAIALLGRDLGLQVLAEGIETERQATAVEELGCELGQGFLFGRPMSAADTTAWLLARQIGVAPRLTAPAAQ